MSATTQYNPQYKPTENAGYFNNPNNQVLTFPEDASYEDNVNELFDDEDARRREES
jgi:hypothetical protein